MSSYAVALISVILIVERIHALRLRCRKSCINSRRACGGYDCYMKALCFRLLIQQTLTAAEVSKAANSRDSTKHGDSFHTRAWRLQRGSAWGYSWACVVESKERQQERQDEAKVGSGEIDR